MQNVGIVAKISGKSICKTQWKVDRTKTGG